MRDAGVDELEGDGLAAAVGDLEGGPVQVAKGGDLREGRGGVAMRLPVEDDAAAVEGDFAVGQHLGGAAELGTVDGADHVARIVSRVVVPNEESKKTGTSLRLASLRTLVSTNSKVTGVPLPTVIWNCMPSRLAMVGTLAAVMPPMAAGTWPASRLPTTM